MAGDVSAACYTPILSCKPGLPEGWVTREPSYPCGRGYLQGHLRQRNQEQEC